MNKKSNSGKIILVMFAALLLGFIGWRIYMVHFASQDNNSEIQEIVEVSESPLNDHQQELMNNYTSADWDFIALLSSNLWTTNNDTSSLVFDDSTYACVVNGQKGEATPYAISALKKNQVTADGETINEYTCSFETAKGTYILTLQQSTTDEKLMSLSCDAFNSGAYVRADAATDFKVEGVPEQVWKVIGSDEKELTKALQEYCSINFPTASSANCMQAMNIDYAEGVADIPFALDNNAKSQVTVTYNFATNAFSVSSLR